MTEPAGKVEMVASKAPPALHTTMIDGVVTAPTRPEIRAYVADQMRRLLEHGKAGGNAHQYLFDHQDQLDRFAATIPDPARDEFLRIYTEELSAALEGMKRAADVKELGEYRALGKKSAWIGVIGTVVTVLVLYFIFSAL